MKNEHPLKATWRSMLWRRRHKYYAGRIWVCERWEASFDRMVFSSLA